MGNIEQIIELKNELARSKGFLDWDELVENSSDYDVKNAKDDIDRKYFSTDSGYDDFDA